MAGLENLDLRLPAVTRRVAVIGAGWAGLAAAVTLAGKVDVTVFEAGRRPGGRARALDEGGLDNGQHILIGAYEACLELMRRVGASPETLLHRVPMQWLRAGGLEMRCPPWPAPLHLAAGLLAARGLSWREKWHLLRTLDRLKRQQWRVPASQTVMDWLQATAQPSRLVADFWQPLVLSALNTPPALASMQILAHVLRDSLGADRAASDLLLPSANLSGLFPAPAWQWLAGQGASLRAGHRVRSLVPAKTGVTVDGECFDAAIVAVAPYHARGLLPENLLPALHSFDYQPIYTVYLHYPGPVPLPAPMCGVAGGVADWVFDRAALTGEPGLVAAVISAPANDPLAEGREALVARVADEVARLAGRPLKPPAHSRIVVEKRATFVARPGMSRPGPRLDVKWLYVAGDWTDTGYPATLEGAVRSGVAAAHACLQDGKPI
ncbi:squalene-associated FAD-dependent desaturase [Gulbenkiania indica]|uniref:Squalene-associated FAD-dependent desaturase n=1 Tax=Gulbenkiania indica TaxID=375574 RepID=A0A0K6GUU7_9NEIS|nr:squalene-associated FAD-dependent desaturase [Gulbenkiania indica]